MKPTSGGSAQTLRRHREATKMQSRVCAATLCNIRLYSHSFALWLPRWTSFLFLGSAPRCRLQTWPGSPYPVFLERLRHPVPVRRFAEGALGENMHSRWPRLLAMVTTLLGAAGGVTGPASALTFTEFPVST